MALDPTSHFLGNTTEKLPSPNSGIMIKKIRISLALGTDIVLQWTCKIRTVDIISYSLDPGAGGVSQCLRGFTLVTSTNEATNYL